VERQDQVEGWGNHRIKGLVEEVWRLFVLQEQGTRKTEWILNLVELKFGVGKKVGWVNEE
jgi:hypothetical protein